jgi:hypothetical protein
MVFNTDIFIYLLKNLVSIFFATFEFFETFRFQQLTKMISKI